MEQGCHNGRNGGDLFARIFEVQHQNASITDA